MFMPEFVALPAATTTLKAALLAWYDRHKRELPWRGSSTKRVDPYHVMVSELMLQQTTVKTVKTRFTGFIERFPTVAILASAPEDDVLHAWQGLGYYRRARALRNAARVIVDRHDGEVPASVEALQALPGIGNYTARAIAAMAFDIPVIPVDGNVRRVLTRLAAVDLPAARLARPVERLADALASDLRPGDSAQALIELGALCCRPRSPECGTCPWKDHCIAHVRGLAGLLPRPPIRKDKRHLFATAWLFRRDDGAILLRRRPKDGLLGGLIELPTSPWIEENTMAGPGWGGDLALVPGTVTHVFTHIRLELHLMRGHCEVAADGFFHSADHLDELALPTLTKKLLRHGGIDC